MGNSTVTLQSVVDWAALFPDVKSVLGETGYAVGPACITANDTMQYILGEKFPWKFSQIPIPVFYSNSWQQDYAVYGITNLGWLQDGNILDVNNTSNPKPRLQVEVDRYLPQTSASMVSNSLFSQPKFFVNWLPNYNLYYGTWGSTNSGSTAGNDPVANSVYTNPVGAGNQPSNPITQIRDANGNLLVLTVYGHEGSTAPVAPANSLPGTLATPGAGATTQWTVLDPYGQGFRILPIPSQSGIAWQFNLIGQQRPPLFTSLQQTLDPLPDDYATLFRQGFVAMCYKRSPLAKVQAKFKIEFDLWQADLKKAKEKSDRERDAAGFVADSIVAPLSSGYLGPIWPFGYPIS